PAARRGGRGNGIDRGRGVRPADWNAIFFRPGPAGLRLCTQLLDETLPAPATLRSRLGWKSRRSHSGFSISGARLSVQEPARLRQPQLLLDVFRYVGQHGVKLSREAEDQIRDALPGIFDPGLALPGLWSNLREILLTPYAAQALRAMHSSGLLVRLFPEFGAIDSLVMRDYYH